MNGKDANEFLRRKQRGKIVSIRFWWERARAHTQHKKHCNTCFTSKRMNATGYEGADKESDFE